MAEQEKEVRKFIIQEDELNVLLAFIGKQPLEQALQSFGVLQVVTQRPFEESKKTATTRKIKKTE